MKLALITGGSKGLGKALVDQYLQDNWTVQEFSRSGSSKQHVQCDFADAQNSMRIIEDRFVALSGQNWSDIVLINNVGILNPIGPIETGTVEQWQQNIQINLNASIATTGLFIRHFDDAAAKRYVVNISSGAAVTPFFGWSLYCAAKAGLEAFTACVALEQAKRANPTVVFSVRPGVIDTGMQQQIRDQDENHFADIKDFKALKRDKQLQTAEDVAAKVLRLLQQSPIAGHHYSIYDLD